MISAAMWRAFRRCVRTLQLPLHMHTQAGLPCRCCLQVIHMMKGVADPGPAFQLDAVRDAYTPRQGVHLHSSSHGSARSLLARFAQAATAVRRVQAFCSAALRSAGSVGAMDAAVGGSQEQREEQRLFSLPTVAAFAAAVAEQQQGLQQQVLVLEAAFNSGALTSLLQLAQRTAGLAQQAALLAALARRCCAWRGSPAETAAGLLSGLYDALQLQLLQARSQGGQVLPRIAFRCHAWLPAARVVRTTRPCAPHPTAHPSLSATVLDVYCRRGGGCHADARLHSLLPPAAGGAARLAVPRPVG